MKKKLFLILVILLAANVFAQVQFQYYSGWRYSATYLGNGSMEQLRTTSNQHAQKWQQQFNANVRPISKLPNSVLQVVNHALEDYNLDIGDMFLITVANPSYPSQFYSIFLRITSRRGAYEFHALNVYE